MGFIHKEEQAHECKPPDVADKGDIWLCDYMGCGKVFGCVDWVTRGKGIVIMNAHWVRYGWLKSRRLKNKYGSCP